MRPAGDTPRVCGRFPPLKRGALEGRTGVAPYVLRPTPCALRPGAVRRLCEAPVRPRYVERYRCEAIQCRGDNIRTTYRRILRQPWIASPHIIATYRKCGGGFAMTGAGASLIRWQDVSTPRTAREPPRRADAPPVLLSKAPLFRGGKRPQTRGVSPAGRNPRPSPRL
ncbi:MAG: hypothetical protein LBM98_00125 [Oscillospiraceae bacterium]|nr:hypothetical protein [Oscillospiraceae bacterium]